MTLYFAGCLYRGNRSTKVSAGSFDAFDSPNLPPLVTMKVKIEGKKLSSLTLSTRKQLIFKNFCILSIEMRGLKHVVFRLFK